MTRTLTLIAAVILIAGCSAPTDPAPRVEPMELHQFQDDEDSRDTFPDTLPPSDCEADSLDCRWDELDKDGLPLSVGGL